MNIRNILILALASLSCLQSYGMEKQIVSSKSGYTQKTSSKNNFTTTPLRKNKEKKPTEDSIFNKIKTQISNMDFLDDPTFNNLLTSNEASQLSKKEKEYLYAFAKKTKKACREEEYSNSIDQEISELEYKSAQQTTRCLKLFKVLPDLDFPQAIFTNAPSDIPYKNIKLHPETDEILAAMICNEQSKISICCFHLFSDPISRALLKKNKTGVSIELITNKDQGGGRDANKTIKELLKNKITVLAPQNHQYEQMHHKYFIFERNVFNKPLMVNGSYNPTPHGNLNSWDDMTIQNHPKLINQYKARYKEVKNRSKAVTL